MAPTIIYPLLSFLALVLLSAIGFGPTLYLLSYKNPRRVSHALLIAPVVGLALIALAVYPLFLNSIPVNQILLPLTIIPLIISGVLILLDFRFRRFDYQYLFSRNNRIYLVIWMLIFVLLMLPAFAGGDKYRYWQGNQFDATNYWSITYLAQQVPFDEIGDENAISNASQTNPALLMPLSTEPTRLVVELPFAWLSLLFNIPVYEFYYYFKILSLLAAFLTTIAIAERLKLSLLYRIGLASVISVGFWAWYVLDVDALSQIYSIPLALLLGYAWIQLEEDAPLRLISRQRFLFSFVFAALICYYPEIIPLILLAMILFYIKVAFDSPLNTIWRRTAGLLISLVLACALLLPVISQVIYDLVSQLSFATTSRSDNWAIDFYTWLYAKETFIGRLWGTFYFDRQQIVTMAISLALGTTLSIILIIGIVKSIVLKLINPGIIIFACLAASFWGGALLIFILGREWVAGKALAMGYPFVLIALFTFIYQINSTPMTRQIVRFVTLGSLLIWTVLQISVPVIRAKYFSADQPFPDYVSTSSPIGNLVPIINYLQNHPSDLVVSKFEIAPLATGLEMMLTDNVRHQIMRGISRNYNNRALPFEFWQDIQEAPSHLVFGSPDNFMHEMGLGTPILLDTPFQLYTVKPEELNESVFRSNLLIQDQMQGFSTAYMPLNSGNEIWFREVENANPGHIRFLAGNSQPIGIAIGFLSDVPASVSITLNQQELLSSISVQPDEIEYEAICTNMQPGANDLLIDYSTDEESPSTLLKIIRFQIIPADSMRIDVGATGDGMQSSDGWYRSESVNENFRWVTQTASFNLFTCQSSDYRLRFRVASIFDEGESQNLTVWVNGNIIDEINLQSDLQEYEVIVPVNLLSSDGVQRITFEHADVIVAPNDVRELSARYDWIEFEALPSEAN